MSRREGLLGFQYLGPLQVVLNVSNDQASASFTAAQPEVRQALEAALPRLREMMSDAGVTLGSATVGTNMPDQRQAQGEQARSGQGGGNGGGFGRDGGGDSVERAPRAVARNTPAGAVDTFA